MTLAALVDLKTLGSVISVNPGLDVLMRLI